MPRLDFESRQDAAPTAGCQPHASWDEFGDALHISFIKLPNDTMWAKWKSEAKGNLQSWGQIEPSIEDIFLEMMESMDE